MLASRTPPFERSSVARRPGRLKVDGGSVGGSVVTAGKKSDRGRGVRAFVAGSREDRLGGPGGGIDRRGEGHAVVTPPSGDPVNGIDQLRRTPTARFGCPGNRSNPVQTKDRSRGGPLGHHARRTPGPPPAPFPSVACPKRARARPTEVDRARRRVRSGAGAGPDFPRWTSRAETGAAEGRTSGGRRPRAGSAAGRGWPPAPPVRRGRRPATGRRGRCPPGPGRRAGAPGRSRGLRPRRRRPGR